MFRFPMQKIHVERGRSNDFLAKSVWHLFHAPQFEAQDDTQKDAAVYCRVCEQKLSLCNDTLFLVLRLHPLLRVVDFSAWSSLKPPHFPGFESSLFAFANNDGLVPNVVPFPPRVCPCACRCTPIIAGVHGRSGGYVQHGGRCEQPLLACTEEPRADNLSIDLEVKLRIDCGYILREDQNCHNISLLVDCSLCACVLNSFDFQDAVI